MIANLISIWVVKTLKKCQFSLQKKIRQIKAVYTGKKYESSPDLCSKSKRFDSMNMQIFLEAPIEINIPCFKVSNFKTFVIVKMKKWSKNLNRSFAIHKYYWTIMTIQHFFLYQGRKNVWNARITDRNMDENFLLPGLWKFAR